MQISAKASYTISQIFYSQFAVFQEVFFYFSLVFIFLVVFKFMSLTISLARFTTVTCRLTNHVRRRFWSTRSSSSTPVAIALPPQPMAMQRQAQRQITRSWRRLWLTAGHS
jgi:hypothetical protein